MPARKIHVGFISNAWSYHDDYDRLTQVFAASPNFNFCNYSTPDKPNSHFFIN